VKAACAAIADSGLNIAQTSRFFSSRAFPPGAGPDYVNSTIRLAGPFGSDKAAGDLLRILHKIEEDFGRTRSTRWGARVLDLDLLGIDDLVLPDAATQKRWVALPLSEQAKAVPDQLLLPHPRLQDRAFVLVPLAEIAPDWVHPVTGLSVKEMRAALPQADIDAIRAINDTSSGF
jgi:2-amino-4-hydroxy-6-hydroxymethyldihydropteridine diphosphokinase